MLSKSSQLGGIWAHSSISYRASQNEADSGLHRRHQRFVKEIFYWNTFLWKYKIQQDLNQLLNGGRLTLHKYSKLSKLHWINSGDDDYTYDDISIDDLMSMGDPLSKWGQTQAGFKHFLKIYIVSIYAIKVHWILKLKPKIALHQALNSKWYLGLQKCKSSRIWTQEKRRRRKWSWSMGIQSTSRCYGL